MKNKIRQFLRNVKYEVLRLKFKLLGYEVGKHFVVGKKSYVEKKGFKAGHNVYIGPYSYIGPNTEIGDFGMLSDHIHIIGDDHVFEKVGTPIILAGRPIDQPKTVIESDVWIGHAVTIMRGVVIGEGSIVGANSVVTKDIPPYSIYAGNPAKFIRNRFVNEDDKQAHSKVLKSFYKDIN